MTCPHSEIEAALDRWMESHWYIHQIEDHYHFPEPFRYSLNSFIRAIKEVPQLLKMELQNKSDYRTHVKPIVDSAYGDPLLRLLHRKRDFIVHHGMLEVLSTGMVGTTEGRGLKFGVRFPVSSEESSDEAYERFEHVCRHHPDFRVLAGPDCDSWPCIRREWKIQEFPDTDLLDLAVGAWRLTGSVVSQIVGHLGAPALDLSLPCRHDPERVRMREYSQERFLERVDGINIGAEHEAALDVDSAGAQSPPVS